MRALTIAVLTIMLGCISYYFLSDQKVTVVNGYYDGSTARIIVDALPSLTRKKLTGGSIIRMKLDVSIIFLLALKVRFS